MAKSNMAKSNMAKSNMAKKVPNPDGKTTTKDKIPTPATVKTTSNYSFEPKNLTVLYQSSRSTVKMTSDFSKEAFCKFLEIVPKSDSTIPVILMNQEHAAALAASADLHDYFDPAVRLEFVTQGFIGMILGFPLVTDCYFEEKDRFNKPGIEALLVDKNDDTLQAMKAMGIIPTD